MAGLAGSQTRQISADPEGLLTSATGPSSEARIEGRITRVTTPISYKVMESVKKLP